MKSTIRIITAFALAATFIALAACNTTKGFGTDIEKAGEGLKGSAERNGAE